MLGTRLWAAGDLAKSAGVSGGFCVHVGASDEKLAAKLISTGPFLVQLLGTDRAAAEKLRALVRGRKLYGRITVDRSPLGTLPYADNLVNLLVVEDAAAASVAGLRLERCFRVLAPGGGICLGGAVDPGKLAAAGFVAQGKAAGYTLGRKPRPEEMDDWGHARHGPARTRTSNDAIAGPPRQLRWIDVPRRARNHNTGMIAAVSAGGRLFTIVDCAPPFLSVRADIRLIARDAFSGVVLWERRYPGKNRETSPYGGTLVADERHVYTVASANGPAVCLASKTGDVIRTFQKTRPREMLLVGKLLMLSEGSVVRAFDTVSGAQRWSANVGNRKNAMLAAEGKLFVHYGRSPLVTCLNMATGATLWKQSDPFFENSGMVGCVSGTLVLSRGGALAGVDVADGKIRWRHKYIKSNRGSSANVFFPSGLAWVHSKDDKKGNPYGGGNWQGINLVSGKVERSIPGRFTDKCAPGVATERFLITGRMDFFEVKSGKRFGSGGTRGVCRLGGIPANGMIYTFPTDCRCFPHIKGIMGAGPASEASAPAPEKDKTRLVRGPAWGKSRESQPAARPTEDWPMYRHDAERGGVAGTRVPATLKELWSADVGSRPSQATTAGGKVFVSSIDGHQIHALEPSNGRKLWSYATGARIDAPPTCHGGTIIFGCRDGHVYCLRAEDGKLVWRFRAAPREQKLVAYGQPESSWPVPGSLPIVDGKLFVIAGRHTGMDGGVYVYALEPATGKVIWHSRPKYPWFADMPVRSGKHVFVGPLKFDPATGANPRTSRSNDKYFSAGGSSPFRDPTYSVRTQWNAAGRASGQMLCFDAKRVLGFHGNVEKSKYSFTRPGKGEYKLFMKVSKGKSWKVALPIRPSAILLTPQTAFAAGPPDTYPFKGGKLYAYSTADGKELSSLDLGAAPTFDGMSAANGNLYVSTEDGKLHCFTKQ